MPDQPPETLVPEFEETLHWPQHVKLPILLAAGSFSLLLLILLAAALVTGQVPKSLGLSQTELIIAALIAIAIESGIIAFFSRPALRTILYYDRILLWAPPFRRRQIAMNQIQHVSIASRQRLNELARSSQHGSIDAEAWGTGLAEAVQLELTDGTKVFIGTEQPDQLAAIIQRCVRFARRHRG